MIVAPTRAKVGLTAITYVAPLWTRPPARTRLGATTLTGVSAASSAGARARISRFRRVISARIVGRQFSGK